MESTVLCSHAQDVWLQGTKGTHTDDLQPCKTESHLIQLHIAGTCAEDPVAAMFREMTETGLNNALHL